VTPPFSRPELVSLTNPARFDVEFVVFPGAGSGPSSFSPWCGVVPDTWRLTSVCLPGRSTRIAEELPTDLNRVVDDLTDAITSELDGPLVLFGHSMGGLLALEVAARVDPLVVITAAAAPVTRTMLTVDTPLEVVREYLLEELLDLAVPIMQADRLLLHGYGTPAIRLDCDILAYYGTEDDLHTLDWSRHTTGSAPVIEFPGDHQFPQRAAGQLVDDIARRLAALTRQDRAA
jgi:surfactin synthase thioesterase subunit